MENKLIDEILKSKLQHLKNHPCYLPHFGKNYFLANVKILIIAESHYLPDFYNNKISVADWYIEPDKIYKLITNNNNDGKGWINTREVVKTYLQSNESKGGLSLFYNLEKAYSEIFPEQRLFDDCCYMNYFQRPSEIKGESIKISNLDSEIALENLLVNIEVLQPHKIIFVSSKSYNNFIKNTTEQLRTSLKPFLTSVPHASASSWWNRKSVKFGLKGLPATGREKFIRIITPKK